MDPSAVCQAVRAAKVRERDLAAVEPVECLR
jgi:hypothetical protein